MGSWGRRLGRLIFIAALTSLPACGGYVMHRTAQSRATAPAGVAVGEGVALPTTPPPPTTGAPRAAPAPSDHRISRAPAAARPAGTAPITCPSPKGRATPLNVETRDDSIGLRLTMTVGNKICFAEGESFDIGFGVTNISDHIIEYDTFQLAHFSVTPAAGGQQWHDHGCGRYERRPDDARPVTGPFRLEPAETVNFVADYPGDADSRRRCGGQKGEQRVSGFISICTPAEAHGDDCAPGRTTLLISAPVRIRIG